jgi:hypothetical protein
LTYSAFSTSNFKEGYGVSLSPRIFAKIDPASFKVKEQGCSAYCYVSDNYPADYKSFTKENQTYPIIGTFSFFLSNAVSLSLKNSGADNVYLAVIVDSGRDLINDSLFSSNRESIVVKEGNQAQAQGFIKGDELNRQYSDGYNLYLPLIYSAILVPTAILLFAYAFILRQMSIFQIKEIFLRKMFSASFWESFNALFKERLLVIIAPFLINISVFLPIYVFASIHSGLVFCLLALCEILYLLLFEFLFTLKDIHKIYKSGRIGNEYD